MTLPRFEEIGSLLGVEFHPAALVPESTLIAEKKYLVSSLASHEAIFDDSVSTARI